MSLGTDGEEGLPTGSLFGAKENGGANSPVACRGSGAPGVRCVGAVAGRTPSAPWMDSRGLGKAASSAAFLAGGAWPSPEPLPPCQPSSGWLLILDVVCRQRGLQPAPLLGPQREVSGACRSRSTHGRPRSEAAAWIRGPPGPKDYQRVSRANGEQPQRQSNFSLIYSK